MGFHSQDNLKYGDASIDKALAAGQITPDDADLIRAYAAEYQATRHVSNLRVLKSIFELVNWRRFIRTRTVKSPSPRSTRPSTCSTQSTTSGVNLSNKTPSTIMSRASSVSSTG